MEVSGTGSDGPAVSVLTGREFQVFEMLSEGMTNREIAGAMGVSIRTVETHKENAKIRLNLRSAASLQRVAALWKQ